MERHCEATRTHIEESKKIQYLESKGLRVDASKKPWDIYFPHDPKADLDDAREEEAEDILFFYYPSSGKWRRQWEKTYDIAKNVEELHEKILAYVRANYVVPTQEEADELNELVRETRREYWQSAAEKVIALFKDFKYTLAEHGIPIANAERRGTTLLFSFEVEDILYTIDAMKMEYTTERRGGRANYRSYSFTNCKDMLDTVKLFFWEFRGIEVLPKISLVDLLKTPKAASMQKARRWNNVPQPVSSLKD